MGELFPSSAVPSQKFLHGTLAGLRACDAVVFGLLCDASLLVLPASDAAVGFACDASLASHAGVLRIPFFVPGCTADVEPKPYPAAVCV